MDKLSWCKKQNRGIELVEPNENLCEEYFAKAERALQAAKSLEGNDEWQISSSYYAMYFSLYAILRKIGIKCEIHSCTIEIMKQTLNHHFSKEDVLLMRNALNARINAQYYVGKRIEESEKNTIVKCAPDIYFKFKSLATSISSKEIKQIRHRLEDEPPK